MSLISKRLVGVTASTALLSLVSMAAHAQTDVLNTSILAAEAQNGISFSFYTFTRSMILNSIDVGTDGVSNFVQYKIGTGNLQNVDYSLLSTKDAKGFQRFNLGSLAVDAGTVVEVRVFGPSNKVASVLSTNSDSNVTYSGAQSSSFSGLRLDLTNSNLRVSNPGSNVAPEPGSFALALTGGIALIGICVRRRRNAG